MAGNNRKPMTEAELQFILENAGKMSYTEIGRQIGRRRPAVAYHAKGMLFKKRVDIRHKDGREARGLTIQEAMAFMGLSKSEVYYHMRQTKQGRNRKWTVRWATSSVTANAVPPPTREAAG